ncbi:hypothetical protein TNIN_347481 [Trichonephila inaurata madagascariensis]|uniref:Uncharacterized protein n=1 Tax=Trichonephila inaurata madagascariensis TaxID=2747483 RepID=A0A8X6Y1M3_9ARAC|nr:hypothetical protein TNIN_347481 [Trichonephila inaurata madagascariensis]
MLRYGTHVRRTGSRANRKTRRRRGDRRVMPQTFVDSTVTRFTVKSDVMLLVLQTISRCFSETNPQSKSSFRLLSVTSKHRLVSSQSDAACHRLVKRGV